MSTTYIIKIKDKTPDTHFFVYKNKQFPIKFEYFRKFSKYFLENQEKIQNSKFIQLVDKLTENCIEFQDTVIKDFINYIQQQPISLGKENVVILNYLAKKYDVEQLIEATEEYILANHYELSIQLLTMYQKDGLFNTELFERAISENFQNYINNDQLFNLRFPLLYRIFVNYQTQKKPNLTQKEIIDFFFKCLDKYGRQASVLFSDVDFGENNGEYINRLMTNYSDKFDFHFINSNLILTVYEQQNEILRKTIENQRKSETITQKVEKDIEELKNQYKGQLSQMVNEIDQLKQREKSILDRIYILEQDKSGLISDNETMKKQLLAQMQELKFMEQKLKELGEKEEKNNEIIKKLSQGKTIELNHTEGVEFKGITNYLNEKNGGNIHDKKIVNITSNSIHSDFYPKYLVEHQNDSMFYHSTNDNSDVDICFDFIDKKVQIASYTIKSFSLSSTTNDLRSWDLEVSNDGKQWEIIDEHKNDSILNNNRVVATFGTKKLNGFYRFVRLHQTGKNWINNNYVLLSAIEFYGKLLFPLK